MCARTLRTHTHTGRQAALSLSLSLSHEKKKKKKKKMEKRISRELEKMRSAPPPGISIPDSNVISSTEWHLCLTYPEGNLYTGQTFKLRFRFGPKYPMDSPEVVFIENVPVHEHIYSNGHICMDILYDAWTPAMTVSTVAQSIYSMLSGMHARRTRFLTSSFPSSLSPTTFPRVKKQQQQRRETTTNYPQEPAKNPTTGLPTMFSTQRGARRPVRARSRQYAPLPTHPFTRTQRCQTQKYNATYPLPTTTTTPPPLHHRSGTSTMRTREKRPHFYLSVFEETKKNLRNARKIQKKNDKKKESKRCDRGREREEDEEDG